MIEQGQQIESNTFVPRGTGKFLGTFVLFSPLLPIFRMVGEMSHVKLAVALLFMTPPIMRTDMSILRPKLYPKIFFFSFFSRSFVRNSH